MGRTWKYHPKWSNPITNNTHGVYSLIIGYYPRSLEYSRHKSHIKWCPRRKKNKIWVLWSFLEGRAKYPQKEIQRQMWSRVLWKDPLGTMQARDPSHIHLQNPDTIIDAHKYLLTKAGYSSLLGGSTIAWETQLGTLSASHWTEHCP